ncbi:Helicase associated domain protein [Streptomyces sp. DSM 42041]|uniref:Helicase associated domain protein n=1 Tax=Streptomyces hazeniae TaxID=3075538 RepID=A0ABU2P1W1_9ACTN|nr:Helicase associated domain protein [Streptomyces sp. DSM 42041]MDT0382433.1 Helicase associated domain protein [Streptomyces sp. DSM 42041]
MPRATIVSATGTGKTLVAIRIAEHFAHEGNILVVVPSLDLIAQTAKRWHGDSTIEHMLGICSMPYRQAGAVRKHITLTTKPRVIAEAVAACRGEPIVAFTTYHSLPALTTAHSSHHLPRWSLVIIDEAHRSSGNVHSRSATIHDDAAIPAQRRLYMTATPRVWTTEGPRHRGKTPLKVASMNDPAIYGPVVYQLGLADAIDRGILADYRITVPVVNDEELHAFLHTQWAAPHHDGVRLAATQVGLLRAMAAHNLRRVISFHSRIQYADNFSKTLPKTVAAAARNTGIRRLWTHALHSKSSARSRAWHLNEFATIPLLRRLGPHRSALDGAVLCNVRVLSEGVDVPDADAVLFADPKRSASEIIQALGRALRQPLGSGKIATLIIPVYVGQRQTTEQALTSSDFAVVWEVLNGLSAHDAKLYHRFPGTGGKDKNRPTEADPSPERADEIALAIGVRAHQPDTGLWNEGYTAAVRFFKKHGHLDIPSDYTDHTGYHLGLWLGQQRSLYAEGSLPPDRALALTTLNISWPHPPESFEYHLAKAVTAATAHDTLALTTATEHADEDLIAWLHQQRTLANDNQLPPDRVRALSAADPWWNPPWGIDWQHTYAHLRGQLAGNIPPHKVITPSGHPAEPWLDDNITHLHDLEPAQGHLLAQLAIYHPHCHPHAMLLRHHSAPAVREFYRGLRALRQFHHREGHTDVPSYHRETLHNDVVRLGRWLARCRNNAAQMPTPQIEALQALGVQLDPIFRPATLTQDGQEENLTTLPRSTRVATR